LDESHAALPDWTRLDARHAVTMTGELCDAFVDRREGVSALCGWARTRLRGNVSVYGGRNGFLDPDQAPAAAMEVASANWHATARLVGHHLADALVVDIGSTTSDLIPVRHGTPAARGYSDAERLRTGELVYSGAVRTPLMALAPAIQFRGAPIGVMAEHFATTADVYRRLGLLPEDADQQEAADGRGKSLAETETRLARMIGHDRVDGTPEEWRQLAAAFAEAQLSRLEDAASRVLATSGLGQGAPIVGCGVGRFIAADLAERLGLSHRELAPLVAPGADDAWISSCAPAVAVALLVRAD
jgi:probable H4MPT-linked C1 transfer pathway protein